MKTKAQQIVESYVTGSLDLSGCDLKGVTLPKVIFGQPGQMIAFEGKYLLWRSDAGLYYAGCRIALTREQALKHWDRTDDRAMLFTLAILSFAWGMK